MSVIRIHHIENDRMFGLAVQENLFATFDAEATTASTLIDSIKLVVPEKMTESEKATFLDELLNAALTQAETPLPSGG